jgi:putative spermidine/putrescine transport system ATP-binding protein
MRGEIRRIHNLLGSTTIYVTHDQDEALSLADRIVVMREGVVRQVGTPSELYSRPAHADVAEFMGYRNLLPTRITGQNGAFARLAVGIATIEGTAMEPGAAADATVAIRPEDLVVRPDGPVEADVETSEYRGRSFFGTARTPEGLELFFRSERPITIGETVRLAADPAQVLVYPREKTA